MLRVELRPYVHFPTGIVPNDLITEMGLAEHRIHDGFQIVARGRIAVQINASPRFQNAPYLD